jgi:hypothetical protein
VRAVGSEGIEVEVVTSQGWFLGGLSMEGSMARRGSRGVDLGKGLGTGLR